MRLGGDRGEFLLRHLQRARLGVARKNPAGCAHLDHLGAIFALAADLITKLVGRVADALFLAVLLFEARRQVGAVAMPAGRAERVARGHDARPGRIARVHRQTEEPTSELQSLMRISYAVFCLKKKNTKDRDSTQ